MAEAFLQKNFMKNNSEKKLPNGLIYDMSNDDYHFGPGISKSGLDLISRSPRLYKFMKKNLRPQTQAMVIGSALHCLVLEGETAFNEIYAKDLHVNKKTKSGKEKYEEFLEETGEKTIIKSSQKNKTAWGHSDWDKLFFMRDSVLNHPVASALLESGSPEVSGYWIDKTVHKLCKLRMDWYGDSHNVIVDLKTTDDASYTEFARSVDKYRYHVQDSFYRNGMAQIGKPVDEFIFVCVEKTPPYSVALYSLDRDAKRLGAQLYQRNLEKYAECHNADVWPDYPEEVRELELLSYSYKTNIY